MEKKSNICFAADLPEFDREYLKMYIEDGQFIIYGGQVQIGMTADSQCWQSSAPPENGRHSQGKAE